ncbi:ASCH domain-containing protein [Serratia marcescens]|uniref:hypothetical protein n=1 Tax=Serratia marcescens TaxID=615 RepID=UPI0007453941|nr:hypothetical protein [Serratia marcescens]CUY07986.1 Uncharacterised protein [Serratia marcescens]CUY22154.1 Uncharacterised protein [Serratia marcescens]CUY56160.1 Uncharacterised protein [Serratia marcescens]CUZ39723.1 Uncharacterised protein [Serratia marcescens]CVA83323.1 Uncharacterised protein [Serratia marcescens]
MKERPVIFNGEMVRAILDGRKTQTRRVIKVQPESKTFGLRKIIESENASEEGKYYWSLSDALGISRARSNPFLCPFGQVGDRLWVRETFAGHYLDDDQIQDIKDGRCKAKCLCEYRADYGDDAECADGWTPSIHMPRWASRITLEITAVRVERLNDISQEDAQAEGMELTGWVPSYSNPDNAGFDETFTPYDNFAMLWQSIYGEESWRANPWVWVIEFKRVGGSDASK